MDDLQRALLEILQSVEDTLLSEGLDDITIATHGGSWRWQTIARARELWKPAGGTEPSLEEFETAVRLISASPQDHARLSELIAGEFARRRLISGGSGD